MSPAQPGAHLAQLPVPKLVVHPVLQVIIDLLHVITSHVEGLGKAQGGRSVPNGAAGDVGDPSRVLLSSGLAVAVRVAHRAQVHVACGGQQQVLSAELHQAN
jgi:hypothetical protein